MGAPRRRALHCWQGRSDHIQETFGFHSPEHLATYDEGWRDGTCMLADGHDGAHQFTDDAEITVRFTDAPK